MNGINKITDRIEAEAQTELDALKAETLSRCEEIKSSYDKLAQEEYWKLVREGAKDCEFQVSRLSSASAMEAKKSVLSMKQDAVSKVLSEATERLCKLPQADYTAFLAKLAGSAAFTGTEEVIFNPRDKAAVSKAVVKAANDILKTRGLQPGLTVSDESRDFMGGLMVKQGDIEINCCVEKLVELSREKLASQIADILFTD